MGLPISWLQQPYLLVAGRDTLTNGLIVILHPFGKDIKFFYIDHNEKRIDVAMTAEQFISALIQHIPPRQFKMIRYYGAYARRAKGKYGAKARSSIKQLNLFAFGVEKTTYCPYCRSPMEFVMYCKKRPPDPPKIQREILSWISENAVVA